jgi:hypothetical protein
MGLVSTAATARGAWVELWEERWEVDWEAD